MPLITEELPYDGFAQRVERHDLDGIVQEVRDALRSFTLKIDETKHANGTKWIREQIDLGFEALGGWVKITVGGVDWTKSSDRDAVVGVEVQVSGRSDLLAVDVLHLQKDLNEGKLDVGLIVVPDDILSPYLTDRTPNLRTARKHTEPHSHNMPVCLIAFRHDGIGHSIPKARTNLGRD